MRAHASAAAAAAACDVNVDVTRHNFAAVLPAVRDALARCEFFALDCEMTGLFLEANRSEYADDAQARYEKMAASARSFVITQFGLSCFERVGNGGEGGGSGEGGGENGEGESGGGGDAYEARTFNFWVFPQPPPGDIASSLPEALANRRFVCEAASLAFLSEQGFDFNSCIANGIPFLPLRQRDLLLAQVSAARGVAVALFWCVYGAVRVFRESFPSALACANSQPSLTPTTINLAHSSRATASATAPTPRTAAAAPSSARPSRSPTRPTSRSSRRSKRAWPSGSRRARPARPSSCCPRRARGGGC